MSALLFYSPQDPAELWAAELRKTLPDDVDVRLHPAVGDPKDVEYILCWRPMPGLLGSLPNLKLILSLAAGFDHVLQVPDRPVHVPIVRIVDDFLSAMMAEYAVHAVLGFHRDMPRYRVAQRDRRWDRGWPQYTPDIHVGVLGLGAIGAEVARKLAVFGFQVHGWARTAKTIDGITCHVGESGLAAMLPHCRHLVCVLPLTEDTRGIIDRKTLATLPQGAHVVNIGRGGHVVDADLLAALDAGHIAGAFLDVYNAEPLPSDHAYWGHPQVLMTPHVAGEIVPRSCAHAIARSIVCQRNGEPVPGVANLERGY